MGSCRTPWTWQTSGRVSSGAGRESLCRHSDLKPSPPVLRSCYLMADSTDFVHTLTENPCSKDRTAGSNLKFATHRIYRRPTRPNALPPPAELNPPDGLDATVGRIRPPIPIGLPIPIGPFSPPGLLITTGLFITKGLLTNVERN